MIPDLERAEKWTKRVPCVKHFGTLQTNMDGPDAPFFHRGKPMRASISLAPGEMNATEIELTEPRSEGNLPSI